MVPAEYLNYFVTAAQVGGALIGLLFVAISLAPERTVGASAPVEARVVASSTFTALVNAFFISLAAVLPHWNIGTIVLPLSLLGLISSLRQGWIMLKPWPSWQDVLRRAWLTVVSLYFYVQELVVAVRLLMSPTHPNLVFALGVLLIGIYALALLRAWELLGVQRTSLLAWLSPLHEINKREPTVTTDQLDTQPGKAP